MSDFFTLSKLVEMGLCRRVDVARTTRKFGGKNFLAPKYWREKDLLVLSTSCCYEHVLCFTVPCRQSCSPIWKTFSALSLSLSHTHSRSLTHSLPPSLSLSLSLSLTRQRTLMTTKLWCHHLAFSFFHLLLSFCVSFFLFLYLSLSLSISVILRKWKSIIFFCQHFLGNSFFGERNLIFLGGHNLIRLDANLLDKSMIHVRSDLSFHFRSVSMRSFLSSIFSACQSFITSFMPPGEKW
jgi:hypothetical protein